MILKRVMKKTRYETIKSLYGQETSVIDKRSVSGGDINDAYVLLLSGGEKLFIKENNTRGVDFFMAEAEGLKALGTAGVIKTPAVIQAGEDDAGAFPSPRRPLLFRPDCALSLQ